MAFTEIEAGLDWQAASFVNEFIKGFNERMPENGLDSPYANTDALTELEGGEDIQAASFWAGIQERIEGQYNLGSAIRPGMTTYFFRWQVPYDDAETTYDAMPTPKNWGAVCAYVDELHEDGWRRATTWNPATDDWTDLEDAMWSREGNGHGRMQAGDIIGPWIFADLQTALDNMRTRLVYSGLPWARGEQVSVSSNLGVDYDDLVDDFDVASPTAFFGGPGAAHNISTTLDREGLSRSRAKFGLYEDNQDAEDFTLVEMEEWAIGATENDTVDYYGLVAISDNYEEYDDHETGYIEDDHNKAATTTIEAVSDYVGSLSPAPNEVSIYWIGNVVRGFSMTPTFIFIRFNFEWTK